MNEPRTTQVVLAKRTMTVPMHETPEKSQELADTINARVAELERAADRVDTQAYALRIAYESTLARILVEARAEADTDELVDALEDLRVRLAGVLGGTPTPPPRTPADEPPPNVVNLADRKRRKSSSR